MPGVSQRAAETPASPIRKLIPYADAAAAQGVKIYYLNIGQPDLPPPAEFWTAIKGTTNPMVEYSNSAGNASLRKKVRESYARRGISLKENELIITTAGSEALIFSMLTALNPGDEVIIPEPLYANYNGFAAISGVNVVPITCKIEEDFRLPSLADFEARITPRTRAILICNPNNPTGTVYDRAQLEGIAEICLRHNLYFISDEVYRNFNYTDAAVPSVLELGGMEQHAICVDSVSKQFSLCGARVGFLISRNAEFMTGATRMAQARLSPPAVEQIGVEACMDAGPEYFEGVRTEYIARRDTLLRLLSEIPGVRVPKVDGAFYAMVELPIEDCDHYCQWMLEEFRHEGQTVMMAPGTGFYATPGSGRNQVRIAYVLKQADLERAIECIAASLAVYPGRVAQPTIMK